jgi:hypothetical protein
MANNINTVLTAYDAAAIIEMTRRLRRLRQAAAHLQTCNFAIQPTV